MNPEKVYEERAQVFSDALKKFGVMALPRQANPQALGNVTLRYSWHIDPSKFKITAAEVMQKLPTPGQSVLAVWAQAPAACADAIRARRPVTKTGAIMLIRATRTASALLSGSSKMARTR